MLFYLLTFPFVLALLVMWGAITLQSILGESVSKLAKSNRGLDIFFCSAWLGISVVAGLMTVTSQMLPVTLFVGIGILTLPAVLLIFPRYRREVSTLLIMFYRSRSNWLRFLLTLILLVIPVAYIGSQLIVYFDTAFYHLPVARLIEKYGAIKGIVLIFLNFGQISSWFVLSAPGTTGGENGWGAQSASVYLTMLAATQAAFAITYFATGSKRLSDTIAGVGFVLVILMATRWGMVASLSPDLPAMFLVVVVAWFLSLENTKFSTPAILPVAAFAVTIKLSVVPIAIIVVIVAFREWSQNQRSLIFSISIASAIICPYISLSVLTNGCIAFPVAATCLDLPWTPSIEQLTGQANLIMDAARGGGHVLPPETSISDALLRWVFRDTSGAIIVVGGLILVASILAMKFTRGKIIAISLWPLLLAATGIVYVAILAPSGRFGGGYTAVLASIFVFSVIQFSARTSNYFRSPLLPSGCAAAFLIVHMTNPGNSVRDIISERVREGIYQSASSGYLTPKNLIQFDIHQPTSQQAPRWVTKIVDGVLITIPTHNNECWATRPPCFPHESDANNIKFELSEGGVLHGMSPKSNE